MMNILDTFIFTPDHNTTWFKRLLQVDIQSGVYFHIASLNQQAAFDETAYATTAKAYINSLNVDIANIELNPLFFKS